MFVNIFNLTTIVLIRISVYLLQGEPNVAPLYIDEVWHMWIVHILCSHPINMHTILQIHVCSNYADAFKYNSIAIMLMQLQCLLGGALCIGYDKNHIYISDCEGVMRTPKSLSPWVVWAAECNIGCALHTAQSGKYVSLPRLY